MSTKITQETTQNSYTVTNPDAQGNPMTSTILSGVSTETTTKSGVSVPSYREKLRSGLNATSPYSVIATRRRATHGYAIGVMSQSFSGQFKTVSRKIQGRFAPYTLADTGGSSFVTNAINEGTLAFLKRVRKKQTLFQGGIFLGEFKQALHGIMNPAGAIKDLMTRNLFAYDKLRRRRYKSKKHFRSVIRSTWLEWAFHWAPLISDAEDAAKALAEQIGKFRREIEPVHHKLDFTTGLGSVSVNDAYIPSSSIICHRLVTTGTIQVQSSHAGGVRCAAYGGANSGFDSRLWGLHPRDFVPTIWELIPFSWAIDYFSNIGEVLTCWSYGTSGLVWYSRTDKVTRSCTTTASLNEEQNVKTYVSNPRWLSGHGSPSSSTHSRFTLNRGSVVYSPTVSWNIEFPGWRKAINLASVLTLRAGVSSNLSRFEKLLK
jgi:hypothetical protein